MTSVILASGSSRKHSGVNRSIDLQGNLPTGPAVFICFGLVFCLRPFCWITNGLLVLERTFSDIRGWAWAGIIICFLLWL
ncbi:hypothetical protein BDV41DRAFT_524222 [Aspergillus transmontanensis]|uniref:Uncharacterized protein n=1 Tax=Aspergillus transmontanensis TaxID=1034304 RepID=A0A5N6WEY8_9EURO|nr:hypothetical protein BDV41DRAFT_524222 [Aspergillus transmontanensis]